ncbi:hypothetical protein OVS_01485 [Mycoplasma ovis str. Michigan]|uniref:TNase-like domain-containing protein n=1 Tax=Mycoplasma ovis str. Michigan TaxID=1415773 RepID=A0ABN4BQR6_9MOLU|nr:hypothetical protein [Mycoplasma ovis]AHC40204.1 hypothetical protein OVS_01485 [Mycoplasma ovis str. Michigan]
MAFWLFLKKVLILGVVMGAPVALVFSDFYGKGTTLEVMSGEATTVAGQKKVAILVKKENEIQSVDLSSLNCESSREQKKLLGVGVLSEIDSKQLVGDFIKGGLVAVGCGTSNKLEVIGKSENFWYGVLDYENVVVEWLQAKTYKTEKESESVLKPYYECFNKKLPLLGAKLKEAFSGEQIKVETKKVSLNGLPDCEDKVFSNQVMTIYTKNGNGETWKEGDGWGEFKGAYGDRLNNIEVGDGKIRTSDGKIFNEFPRKITLRSKN